MRVIFLNKEVVLIPQRRTFKELQDCLYRNHPDIEILEGEYINYNSKFTLFHHKCLYTWVTTPYSIFKGCGCPKCGNVIRKTHNQFIEELKNINPNIKILGKYKSNQEKIKCLCLSDNCEWEAIPSNLLRGHGCPICDGKTVVKGINDLNTKHPELQKYLFNIEDGFKYTSNSHKKIKCKCPDCGFIKSIIIKNLVNQGFSCDRCSDGISYPNKFIREMLRQLLGNNYMCEYNDIWCKSYRYDTYFMFNNRHYIIEMDGAFHIDEKSWGNHDYLKQQESDKEKDILAKENDVCLIRINSVKSEKDYIKNNIVNSELSNIFNLDSIDWDLCNEKALSNIAKEACDYYENNKYNMSDFEMAKHFGVYIQTFRKYIKQGLELNWCSKTDYDNLIIRAKFNNNPKSKPVQVYKDNLFIGEYPSLNNCARDLSIKYKDKFYGSEISKCIKGNREYHGFLFKYKICE